MRPLVRQRDLLSNCTRAADRKERMNLMRCRDRCVVSAILTSCSCYAVRRTMRQSKVRENVWKEGRCRMRGRI
jgi:hypothetical protein